MITTKNLVTSAHDVPSYWVFEYYCKLSVKLTGQTEKIKSLFNPAEKTPSFVIYVSNNEYVFNDFSSGKGGNKLLFVQYYFNLSVGDAVNKVIDDYRNYLNNVPIDDRGIIQQPTRYEIENYTKRSWNKEDAKFWLQYNISSSILEKYRVIPVSSFTFLKEKEGREHHTTIALPFIYIYTRLDGTAYKIYQPHNTDRKFTKVTNYIQGTDQLKFEKPNLIIGSSLKDIMCLSSFGFNAEFVAPDSENTIIPSGAISIYKSKYKNVITLFDNDEAGIKGMNKYKSTYDIPGVILPLSKDISDSVRDHGLEKTREVLYPLLKEAINK